MTQIALSRSPFASPNLPTFADLIERVRGDETLPQRTRENWLWALKAIARAAHKAPSEIPAHPEFLRPIIATASPAAIGLSRAAWNNARSLLSKILEWAGLASMPGHYQVPFTCAWSLLWDQLPPGKNSVRMQLRRLFHYCSGAGIDPEGVNDEVLSAFYEALIRESIVKLPYETYRGAAKSWNNAAERIAGWPRQRLTVPSR